MRGHFTQWAAQFAVASELCKRGYEVSFTMGNSTPLADLMVISPKGEAFSIDVKGLYRKNPWLIKRKAQQKNLYYVLAFVPNDDANQFFILSQKDVNKLIKSELDRLNRPDDYPVTGIVWSCASPFENKWSKLPQ